MQFRRYWRFCWGGVIFSPHTTYISALEDEAVQWWLIVNPHKCKVMMTNQCYRTGLTDHTHKLQDRISTSTIISPTLSWGCARTFGYFCTEDPGYPSGMWTNSRGYPVFGYGSKITTYTPPRPITSCSHPTSPRQAKWRRDFSRWVWNSSTATFSLITN